MTSSQFYVGYLSEFWFETISHEVEDHSKVEIRIDFLFEDNACFYPAKNLDNFNQNSV